MIYFLQRGDGAIKVGTTDQFWRRLADLQAVHGRLQLLGWVEGDKIRESVLHQQFAECQLGRSEWFSPADALLAFIGEFCDKGRPTEATKHKFIAVSDQTLAELRDFSRGLGATYDEALHFLLGKLVGVVDPMMAGRGLRDEYERVVGQCSNE